MNSPHITTLLIILYILRVNGQELEEKFACGRRKIQHRGLIINGNKSNEGDWPWHAAIYHIGTKVSYVCGGSLLDSNSVLTAAHCVYKNGETIRPERVLVRLGKHKLIVNGAHFQEFKVYNIITHPEYRTIDQSNDIAIIRLATEAALTDFVQPICLWDSNKVDLSEATARSGIVIGWGITQSDKLANTLQYAVIPIIPSLTCLKSNRQFFGNFLSDQNFCAGLPNGTGACNGDSGGSLSFEENGVYYIRGIVSLASSRIDNHDLCDSKNYVLFTDVAKYLPWIEIVIPQLKRSEVELELEWMRKSEYIDGKRYVLVLNKVNWLQAATWCRSYGMQFATINNIEEQNVAAALIEKSLLGEPDFDELTWIGGNKLGLNKWYWLQTGTPIKFFNWYTGEPNGINENCIHIQSHSYFFKWNDLDCERTLHFLCEEVKM